MASPRPDPLIAEARRRWTICQEAEDKQRTAILAAKHFRAGNQWPAAIKVQREGGNAIQGMAAQPPRPCLVVDRLSQPLRQVSNQIKTADFTFTVLPNSKGANEDTADIFKGYLRRVWNRARNESPVEWAADQAIEGGIGWFRIRTDYVHQTWDGDPNDPGLFDQELVLERIVNNLSVYCDPSATKPTRSDALYMFVTEDLSHDEFRQRYPKADLRGLAAFATTGDVPSEWYTDKTLRIAEYWRVTYQDRPFTWLKNGTIVERAPAKSDDVRMTRIMKVPVVKGDKINAFESLESFDWVGSRIPLIPILGEELNIDGQVKLRGMIEEGMDAQRMVNYSYSGAIERQALTSKATVLAEARSVGAYKQYWAMRNTVNLAYLPWDSWDTDTNRPLPEPKPIQGEIDISSDIQLMQISEEAIKATTSVYDPSLGKPTGRQQSGKAVQSWQAQADLATSNYPDNVKRALTYAAELMLEIIPKITRTGQLVHILGMDDEPEQVIVGKVFNYGGGALGPQGRQPQPSSPEITPEMASLSKGLHKFYDLNNGTYYVTATMGKASATKLQEGSAALGDLLPHLPPEMTAVITPEYIAQLSFPGSQKIAEMARKALPPALQAQQDGGASPLPPQAQAMLQGLQGQLQQAQQYIQTEQAKQQATIQKAQMDAQVSMQTAHLEAQTKLEIAKISAQAGLAEAEVKAGITDMANRIRILEAMIGVEQQVQQQGHEQRMQGQDHAQDQVLAAHRALQDDKDRAVQVFQAQQAQQASASQTQASDT